MTSNSRTVANASRIIFNFVLESTSGQLFSYLPRTPGLFFIIALFCHQPNIFIFKDKMFILNFFVAALSEEDTLLVNLGFPVFGLFNQYFK